MIDLLRYVYVTAHQYESRIFQQNSYFTEFVKSICMIDFLIKYSEMYQGGDCPQCNNGWNGSLILEATRTDGTLGRVREGVNGKETFSFGHCPNYLNPPPHDPNSGNLVLFFSEVKIQDLKVSLELKILYILYDILYICNLKNS